MQRIQINPPGGPIELEVALIGAGEPLLVFLHEALGSLGGWGDWPQQLCKAADCRGLVFSRYGYGHSQARPARQDWTADYLDIEAPQNLPALFEALGIDAEKERPILFGHGDGGTNRAAVRSRVSAGSRRHHRAGAAFVHRAGRARADTNDARRGRTAGCALGWRGGTTTPRACSWAGAVAGRGRILPTGISAPRWRASAVRPWRCRAGKTSSARWSSWTN
jgi:hypothetical protein